MLVTAVCEVDEVLVFFGGRVVLDVGLVVNEVVESGPSTTVVLGHVPSSHSVMTNSWLV